MESFSKMYHSFLRFWHIPSPQESGKGDIMPCSSCPYWFHLLLQRNKSREKSPFKKFRWPVMPILVARYVKRYLAWVAICFCNFVLTRSNMLCISRSVSIKFSSARFKTSKSQSASLDSLKIFLFTVLSRFLLLFASINHHLLRGGGEH